MCISFSAAPPSFVTKPGKLDVYTDNSTLLNCSAYGLPAVTTRWYRNGIPLEESSDKHTIYKNNSLFIDLLNWEDHGLFQCGAENKAGLNFLQVILNVRSKWLSLVSCYTCLCYLSIYNQSIICCAYSSRTYVHRVYLLRLFFENLRIESSHCSCLHNDA